MRIPPAASVFARQAVIARKKRSLKRQASKPQNNLKRFKKKGKKAAEKKIKNLKRR